MDILNHSAADRNNEIDNLIIAAAAASGDEPVEGEIHRDSSQYDGIIDDPRQGVWRNPFLQPKHVASLQEAVRNVLNENDREFLPVLYSKKYGSELTYQEMMELMDFRGDVEPVERTDALRKHSLIFAVNEAAFRISVYHPAAIFHKRDLAVLARMAVRVAGFEFPGSRSGYLPSNLSSPDEFSEEMEENQQSLRPSLAAPASASMLLQKSGLLASRRDSLKPKLTSHECAVIARTAQDMAHELPNFPLKSREQCSLVENFVYTDAIRLMNISPERLDEEMDFIREVSVIHGRYQSGPRMPSPRLSPYELGMNEAAACLVRLRPTLLTHTLHLIEWSRRVLTVSGLQLSRIPAPASPSNATNVHQSSGSQRGGSNKLFSNQVRPQGENVYNNNYGAGLAYSTANVEYINEYGGNAGSGFISSAGNAGVYHGSNIIDANNAGGLPQVVADAGLANVLDYEWSSGLDSSELIQPLGGPQAIAQLSDYSLEKLGRAQFTVVDPRADMEFANCPLDLVVEEEDIPLDASEILRITGAESLEKVTTLSAPCCGYTSINAFDLARCFNLREVDLSENALRVFPRRLHLPNMKRLDLTGNRFIHLPLIEQFPKLNRLTIDEKMKQLLNPQMLAYFCPRLKYINGQAFEEICSDFTIRIFQEARTIMEPHIRSKWESEFADRCHAVKSREERMRLIETMVQQLREKNFMLDESLGPYRNLLAYRFIEEYLRSKLYGPEGTETDAEPAERRRTRKMVELASEEGFPLGPDDSDMLAEVARDSDETAVQAAGGGPYEDDEEEKEAEARVAGERALFDAADELLGVNFPDLAFAGSQSNGQVQMTLLMDNFGRLHQQQLVPAPGGGYQLVSAVNGAQVGCPLYQLHLGRSLRQGRSIVMTVVRPRGISGRPVAEFLPGELRNKDYVKGYMASEIYKKAVKDTLGQKTTPRKRPGPGRPRKSDPQAPAGKELSTSTAASMVPLSELNPSDLGSIKKPPNNSIPTTVTRPQNTKKSDRMMLDSGDGSAGAGLPPRPKKRKPPGMHRSLRDLCAEPPYGFTPSYLSSGLRTDATLIDYDPLHFIRCHAKDNDAGDSETKVWRCLFEPNPMRPEESTHIVATCGGECVCLINCETGKVMKRFKHMEEEFYTIAWTTVEVEGNKRTNILAAAGRMREIRLLHPEQLVCYAEMKGHTEDITAMIFHQTQPTILFSGDSKASVIVWDIGIPSVPDYKTRYQLLMRLRCPRLDVNPVLNLVFLPHYAYLIAGCEDGLFAWKITDLRLEKREREPDMELKLEVDHEVCIDGLAQLSDNALVIKVVESGEIMVFDFAAVLERRKGLQRVVPIEMRGHLYWQKTDEIYINVSVRQNLGAVLCGDNEGAIWIYDLDPYLDDLHSSSRKKFFVKPIKILEWPECSVQGNRDEDQQLKESITSGFRNPVVNSVEMSSDGHFLAAVTDNNLVCIWRYAPPVVQQQQQQPPPQQQPNLLQQQKSPADSTATSLQQQTASTLLVSSMSLQGMPTGSPVSVVPMLPTVPGTTTVMATDASGNPIDSILIMKGLQWISIHPNREICLYALVLTLGLMDAAEVVGVSEIEEVEDGKDTIPIAHDLDAQERTDDVLLPVFDSQTDTGPLPSLRSKSSPSFASMGLSVNVLKGLHAAGFQRPSPVQVNAIPLGRMGLDMIVQAKAGTGKTVVFSVVLLEAVSPEKNAVQAIVLSPTREVALQSVNVIRQLGQFIEGLQCHLFVGGLPLTEDIQKLVNCHIAVGTPGRLKYLIHAGHLSCHSVRLLVLDEADLLFSGNYTVCAENEAELLSGKNTFPAAINYIWWSLPEVKQVLALSATYTDYLVEQHLPRYLNSPALVRMSAGDPSLLGVRQFFTLVHSNSSAPLDVFNAKVKKLCAILSAVSFRQCLVFSNFHNSAQQLCDTLRHRGWPVSYISSGLDQGERFKAFHSLRSFHCRILVSTDLTSRGVDAENVNLVVSLEIPWKREVYLHRIGRAGRFGSYGASIILVCDKGDDLKSLCRIEDKNAMPIRELPDPIPSNLADSDCQVDTTELVTVTKITSRRKPPTVPLNPVDNLPVTSPSEQSKCSFGSAMQIKSTRLPPNERRIRRTPSRLMQSILAYADAMENHELLSLSVNLGNGCAAAHPSTTPFHPPHDLEVEAIRCLSELIDQTTSANDRLQGSSFDHSRENCTDKKALGDDPVQNTQMPEAVTTPRTNIAYAVAPKGSDAATVAESDVGVRQLTSRQGAVWDEYCRLSAWRHYFYTCWQNELGLYQEKLCEYEELKQQLYQMES
ncbi:hypothetical protein SprV_0100262200 [Sparganum proliferum]